MISSIVSWRSLRRSRMVALSSRRRSQAAISAARGRDGSPRDPITAPPPLMKISGTSDQLWPIPSRVRSEAVALPPPRAPARLTRLPAPGDLSVIHRRDPAPSGQPFVVPFLQSERRVADLITPPPAARCRSPSDTITEQTPNTPPLQVAGYYSAETEHCEKACGRRNVKSCRSDYEVSD